MWYSQKLNGLGATCITAGSAQPSTEFLALTNTTMGKTVGQAVLHSYNLRAVGSETKEELLNRIVAVYLQWTWQPVWSSREDVSIKEIESDPCFEKAVAQVSPLSTARNLGPGPKPDGRQNWLQMYWPWIVGGVALVVVGGALMRSRKRRAPVIGLPILPTSMTARALPAPLEM
jgi:hypothetical protein